MPQFTYFIETGRQACSPGDLRDAGIDYAMWSPSAFSHLLTTSGPEGKGGMLVQCLPDGASTMVRYEPDKQSWRKGPGVPPKYWVGVDNDAKPGPDDLKRQRVYDGTPVRLLDGNDWIVPRCFGYLEGRDATLPRLLDVADDGETVVTRVHPRYQKLCDDAFRWWKQFTGRLPENEHLKPAGMVQLALEALAVNYRIGKVEAIALLGLWGTDEFGLILRAMIDADEMEKKYAIDDAEAAKKTGGETSPPIASAISSGEPAASASPA